MTNFSQMRKNMILGQFLPASIKNNKILKTYETMARESFLPNYHKSIAYSDLNIKVNQKRYLPSPLNSAKILQEANFSGKEVVLLIGANYGYEAAILSSMVETIIAIEEDTKLFNLGERNIKNLNIENLVFLNSKHSNGYKKLGLYDVIINIDLSFHINNELVDQLVNKGKFFFCEQHNNEVRESKLSVIHKSKNGFFKQSLFDINIPFVKTVNNLNDFNFI
jgi:protein-L-isoaspartate(D-aspartate) O-methyltransferase